MRNSKIKLKNILIGIAAIIAVVSVEVGVYFAANPIRQQPTIIIPDVVRVFSFCKTDNIKYQVNLKKCANMPNLYGFDSEFTYYCINAARQSASQCLTMICVSKDFISCTKPPVLCILSHDFKVRQYCKEHEFDNVVYR
jgi:hypothetical protein